MPSKSVHAQIARRTAKNGVTILFMISISFISLLKLEAIADSLRKRIFFSRKEFSFDNRYDFFNSPDIYDALRRILTFPCLSGLPPTNR